MAEPSDKEKILNQLLKEGPTKPIEPFVIPKQGMKTVDLGHGRSRAAVPVQRGDRLGIAAEKNDLVKVRSLIAKGVSVNTKNVGSDVTPLGVAAQRGHVEIIRVLLAAGASVHDETKDGMTPLHIASQFGRTEVVNLLIAAKSNVNSASKLGSTPLIAATVCSCLETIRALLEAGADVNLLRPKSRASRRLGGVEALAQAILGDEALAHLNEPQAGIEACATEAKALDLGSSGYSIVSPDTAAAVDLSCAPPAVAPGACGIAAAGDIVAAAATAGVDAGPHADSVAETPLHIAARLGHPEALRELLRSGEANVLARNGDDETALECAITRGISRRFHECAAILRPFNEALGDVPLAGKPLPYIRDAMQELAACARDAVRSDPAACIPFPREMITAYLRYAAATGDLSSVKELAGSHADCVSVADRREGRTALHEAAAAGHLGCAAALLSRDADVHMVTDSGSTALHLACAGDHALVVSLLLKHGALATTADLGGKRPADVAGRAAASVLAKAAAKFK